MMITSRRSPLPRAWPIGRPASLALAAVLLPALATAQASPQISRLRPGILLYAVPEMGDPNFAESVILLLQQGEGGAMGVIVNRPTEVLARDVLDGVDGIERLSLPVYEGGPVSPGTILALLRAERRPGDADRVLDGVYATTHIEALAEVLGRKDPDRHVRIYAGYAGWAPGQLEDELRHDQWRARPGDAETVFASDPSRLWPEVFELLERLEVRGFRPLRPAGPPSGAWAAKGTIP